MNAALMPIRCQVEQLSGLVKQPFGYRRVRTRGRERNGGHLCLMCATINRRKALNPTG